VTYRPNARMGDVVDLMSGTEADLAEVITLAMQETGEDFKQSWRQAVRDAGLGNRLPNTVRSRFFPDKGQPSLDPASYVYTLSTKIMDAMTRPQVIRAKNKRWLAWATPAAGPKRIKPADWERRNGIPLRFVPLRGGQSALLVADNARLSASGLARRNIGSSRKGGTYTRLAGRATIVIFTLHRTTKTKQRFDLQLLADNAAAGIDGRIAKHWLRMPDRNAPMMMDDNGRALAPFRRYSGPPVRFGS
jgi:hypothetical protein